MPFNKSTSVSPKPASGIHIAWLTLAVSAYIALVFNISFWKGMFKIIGPPDAGDVLFLLSILFSLIAAIHAALSLFGFNGSSLIFATENVVIHCAEYLLSDRFFYGFLRDHDG